LERDRRSAVSPHHSKDELDAYHPGAPPNDFANPMLPTFGKSKLETIRDNRGNDDLRAMRRDIQNLAFAMRATLDLDPVPVVNSIGLAVD